MSQSVDRALLILESLGEGPRLIGELADQLGVHKTTALRLLQTLERHAFVDHDDDHRYRLGGRLFALGHQALQQRDLRQVASSHLRSLNELTGQTIHLAAYDPKRCEVMYIDKCESREPIRMYSWIGKLAPIHCTGVAKAIVAFLPREEREAIAHSIAYPVFTDRTIGAAEALVAELDAVRERGFAIDEGAHEEFVRCIAAPIRDSAGHVVGSISISSLVMVLDLEALLRFLPDLLSTTSAISREYGWDSRTSERTPSTDHARAVSGAAAKR